MFNKDKSKPIKPPKKNGNNFLIVFLNVSMAFAPFM